MPALIDSLRRDHANMELLLTDPEQEIAVFDRSNRPDFDEAARERKRSRQISAQRTLPV